MQNNWKILHIRFFSNLILNQFLYTCLKPSILSNSSFKDNELFEEFITVIDLPISQVSADGAYDSKNCYNISKAKGIKFVVPPRKTDVIQKHDNCRESPILRDLHIREIRKMRRRKWKKKNNYHRMSISKTAMYRFKTLLGDKLSFREFQHQAAEVFIKCKILNQMKTPASIIT